MQVKDLTTTELKALIRETVTQTLRELLAKQQAPQASPKAVVTPQQEVREARIQGTSEPPEMQSSSTEEDSESLDIPIRETAKELGLFISRD